MSIELQEIYKRTSIHSWYNEQQCNREAWIEGVGSVTSPHNREEAILLIKLKAGLIQTNSRP